MKLTERQQAYRAKFKDPRWQKKRLEVMERDNFECQYCGSGKTTLNIHHLYYIGNKDPWDYPLSALLTLCEICHEDETANLPAAEKQLIQALKVAGFNSNNMSELSAALEQWPQTGPIYDPLCSAIAKLLSDKDWLSDLVDKYWTWLEVKLKKKS